MKSKRLIKKLNIVFLFNYYVNLLNKITIMAKRKTPSLTRDILFTRYTEYVNELGNQPASVVFFMKECGYNESDFYRFFASFEALEADFFRELFDHALELSEKSPDYQTYEASQKLSSFYFMFFEAAAANRSFIEIVLKNQKDKLRSLLKLKTVRASFLSFVKEILQTPYATHNRKVDLAQNKLLHEGAWLQFMAVFKFWLEDTSPAFERTDVFIEKAVTAAFDVVYNVPFQSVIDFGKFLWKERTSTFRSS